MHQGAVGKAALELDLDIENLAVARVGVEEDLSPGGIGPRSVEFEGLPVLEVRKEETVAVGADDVDAHRIALTELALVAHVPLDDLGQVEVRVDDQHARLRARPRRVHL